MNEKKKILCDFDIENRSDFRKWSKKMHPDKTNDPLKHEQLKKITNIVKDYNTLLKAEERKFFLGESSLFLVNYRESKLIETKLKAIVLENSFFQSKAVVKSDHSHVFSMKF